MNKKHQIPTPAHPQKRREALPWQQPKATEEDPEALLRVQAILNSPSYRRADNDSDFLARDGVQMTLKRLTTCYYAHNFRRRTIKRYNDGRTGRIPSDVLVDGVTPWR